MPGILNWALAGCREWRQSGLGESATIRAATETYRRDQDLFGAFLDECCELGEGLSELAANLYSEYRCWSQAQGLTPMANVSFGRKLKERGFRSARPGKEKKNTWYGLALQGGARVKYHVVAGGGM